MLAALLPLLLLRRFQKAGHKPVALVGGATGMIGDPSGKSAERNLLSRDVLEENVSGLREQMKRFLDFDAGEQSAELVNNIDWIGQFGYIDFLRDVGKNFPVNVMLAKDSVKGRLERDDAGLSYTEFSYMLLQAYDFVHLHQQFGCELQVGGSDQWGNITAGIDLGRRMHSAQLRGLTSPLLLKSDGSKMGKTESGAVWLSADRTSPYQFYQYWLNSDDSDVGNCLRVLTELSHDEISALDASREADAGKRGEPATASRSAHRVGARGRRSEVGPAGDRHLLRRRNRAPQRRRARGHFCRCAQLRVAAIAIGRGAAAGRRLRGDPACQEQGRGPPYRAAGRGLRE